MYSGLAKACGIYAVLNFFISIPPCSYPLALPAPCTIHVHCNNNGVIECIHNIPSSPHPHNAICNDYPVFAELQALLQAMPMIRAIFHHVKGHQKETADCKLTLPEKLNIDCNAQASQIMPLSTDSPILAKPLTNAGYPHLQIQNQCIIQCLQHIHCDAATIQPHYAYLATKFEWEDPPEQTIQWPLLQLAL